MVVAVPIDGCIPVSDIKGREIACQEQIYGGIHHSATTEFLLEHYLL
jgi:hypothetical protein